MSNRPLELAAVAVGLVLVSAAARAEDKPADKPDHAELARLIHAAVVPHIPKEFEESSGWGKTVPDPGNLRLTRLRTRIRVGDKEELPHGAWIRTKVTLDDPAKDVRIEVRDLKKCDRNTLQIQLAVTVSCHAERERKQWDNGLPLLGLTAQADVTVVVVLNCDVGLSLNVAKFPPEVVIEPRVTKAQLEVKKLEPKQIGNIVLGDRARRLANELKGVFEELLKQYEPVIKERANEAIARSLKEGKASLSPAALLKAEPAKKE
jgi:hypothetical protein